MKTFLLMYLLSVCTYSQVREVENYFIKHDFLEGRVVLEEYVEPVGFFVLERAYPQCHVGVFYDVDAQEVVNIEELYWPLDYAYTQLIYDEQRDFVFLCPV